MLRYTGHALLIMLSAIFIFHSPFTRWWTELNLPWYTVFVLWFVLIVLVALDSAKGNATDGKDDRDDARGD